MMRYLSEAIERGLWFFWRILALIIVINVMSWTIPFYWHLLVRIFTPEMQAP